jgi:hypothetical protein
MTGTGEAWPRERVLGLAPDPASARAADGLAAPSRWSHTGRHGDALWGSCAGSGSRPYQVLVDLSGPAWSCSCPSRKQPCKHALGLLLLAGDGRVAGAPALPPAAEAWLAARAERAGHAAPPAARASEALADPAAAAARAARRAERVRLGLEELDVWLCDQVRGGLAALQRAGYAPVDQMAARMVDAQAPGVAGLLRALPARFVGEGWPARTLEHLAMLRLLVAAHRRLDQLPADLAETVRSRVGYPVSRESVLARPAVRDRWAVLGYVDVQDLRLTTRRVWLRGQATGRWALLLSFAAGGAVLDGSVMPGVTLDADVHLYPGAGQLRGLLGTEDARTGTVGDVEGESVTRAAAAFGELVVADPWAERLPVVLRGAPIPPERDGGRWRFRDVDGAAVPLLAGVEAWQLLARSMGDPVEVMGEWTRDGFLPLGFLPHPLDPVFSPQVLTG